MTEQVAALQPDWISPPGDTIADLLEEKGWSQTEFAQRCGYTTKHISLLVNGKASVTEDTAIKLEKVLGSSVRFWLMREAQFRETIARRKELETLEGDVTWLKELPLDDMIHFGWVMEFSHKGQQVGECLTFFGVSSVDIWRKHYAELRAAFKASAKFKKDGPAVSAWLRQGERRAAEIVCRPFEKEGFKQRLVQLRALSNESEPEVFIPRLVESCAAHGVAVVFVPAPKGCPVSGATRWLSKDKALIMLSLRYKTNDHLWFSFFHEAAHILLHGKKMMFLETKGLEGEQEREADRFARDLLIPPQFATQLPALSRSHAAIRSFAQKVGIAPAIVVGRLQKEKLLNWNMLNGCKIHYRWNTDK